MKLSFYVDPAAALRAGSDLVGRQTLDIPASEIPADLRDWIAQEGHSEQESIKLPSLPGVIATPESVLAALREHREKLLAERAEQERAIREDAVRYRSELEAWIAAGEDVVDMPYWRHATVPEDLRGILVDAKREQKRRQALKREREAAAERAQKEFDAAMHARKSAQLTEVVERRGSDTQKARWKEGLMPRAEAIQLAWEEQVEPIKQAGFTVIPTESYPVEPCDEQQCTLEPDWIAIEKVSDAAYEALTRLREVAPKGAAETFYRFTASQVDEWACECEEVRQVWVEMGWTVGALTFSACVLLEE